MKIRQDKNALPLATRDRGHWPPFVFSIVADIVNISAATCLFPVSSTCSPRCTIMPRSSYVGWNEERERDNEAMERGEGGRKGGGEKKTKRLIHNLLLVQANKLFFLFPSYQKNNQTHNSLSFIIFQRVVIVWPVNLSVPSSPLLLFFRSDSSRTDVFR